jgi:hypothetical protein
MVQFNHEEKTFEQSLGITTDRADYLTASVFYEMINHAYLIDKLFDNSDDAPRNMVTKTGILEKAFEDTVNEAERIFTTWEYAKIDHLEDDKNNVFAGMTMLFQVCGTDKDEFVKRFAQFKADAVRSMKKRREED